MKPDRRPRMGSVIGPMVCLLGTLAAGSAWAQPQAPVPPVSLQGETASAAKPVKAPVKPAAKTTSRKPAMTPKAAPKAATKPRTVSKPAPGTKAKSAPVKRAGKAKSGKAKSGRSVAATEPVPAAAPDVSPASPGTPAAPAPRQPEKLPPLGKLEAEARYREGVELERSGDPRAAITAYHEAGESGHGPAQKKLGDLYGTGNDVVERDYETSLRWYDRARKQGIEIPKPFTYPGVRR
ncbi:MAG: hypothetical protein V1796_01925 [Pseudomonadota bacterium]